MPPILLAEIIDGIAIEGFMPHAVLGSSYTAQLRTLYAVEPVEWSIVDGALPPGWALDDETGAITGEADDAGVYTITVMAADWDDNVTRRTFTWRVVALPLSVTGSLSPMTVGAAVSDVLTLENGYPGYSLGAYTTPAGVTVTIDGATVEFPGAPTGVGLGVGYEHTFLVSITFTDTADGEVTFSQSVDITVPPVVATFASLPDGDEGVAYSGDANATGGTGGYVFSLDAAPSWMSINGGTGALTGAPGPSDVGTGITVTVRATDSEGNYDTVSDTIDVAALVGADDFVTVFAAWSIAKRLVTTYTGPLFRLRHSVTNVEQDIGFDANGDVDTAAITSFIASNSGFLTKIYEQNASGRDFVQATAANQPQLVNAGTIDSEGAHFDGTNDSMQANIGSGNPASAIVTMFARIRAYQNVTSNVVGGVIDCGYGSGSHLGFGVYADERSTSWSPGISVGQTTNGGAPATIKTMLNATYPMGDALHTFTVRFNLTAAAGSAASLDVYRDGSNTGLLTQSNLRPTGTFTRGQMTIGKFGDIAYWCEMKFRSLVVTTADDLADMSNVEPLL